MILLVGHNRAHPETNMGDAVLQIPLILHLARSSAEPIYFEMLNAAVRELVPRRANLFDLRELPAQSVQVTIWSSINDVITRFNRSTHPTLGLFDLHGIPRPSDSWALRPELSFVHQPAPHYDFLIAPFSWDKNREWPLWNWDAVIQGLPGRVGILGAASEPKMWTGVDYQYGLALDQVCSLICSAHCLVTIDTGPARLAHGLGHPNHVLLCSSVVPKVWGTYPGARVIYGATSTWRSDDVLKFALHAYHSRPSKSTP